MGVQWKRNGVAAIKIGLCAMMIGWGIVIDGPKKPVSADVGNLTIPAVAADAKHSMSLSADGTFRVWGNNEDKQLGIAGPVDAMRVPKKLNLDSVASISTGRNHSAIVRTNGELWVFGRNEDGQLGMTPSSRDSLPVRVEGIEGVQAAAVGIKHTLALTDTGEVWELGHNPEDFTSSSFEYHKRLVSGLPEDVDAIAVGDYSSFALSGGELYAWGSNSNGQLGDGTSTNRELPVKVPISGVKSVAAAGYHTLALKEDGTVWAWGSVLCGSLGRVGSDATISTYSPAQVYGLSGIRSIAANFYHNLALGADGKVQAWGCYPYGGDMSNQVTVGSPSSIVPLDNVIAIAAGLAHSLAMTSDGTVWGWGLNEFGQVGDGRTITHEMPIKVDTGAPAAPTDLKAVVGSGKVKLSWMTEDTDIEYYKLYWRPIGGDPFYDMARVYGGTVYEVEGLNPLNRYEFKIEAVDWAGWVSTESVLVLPRQIPQRVIKRPLDL
jgi:alpha-tubulin suppressor-like RCC1 family protein